jgi:hypothetical protein
VLALVCGACGTQTIPPLADDDGGVGSDPGGPGPGMPDAQPVSMVQGHVTADVTWIGDVQVIGRVIIDPGVTVTVAQGTTIDVAENPVGITVQGTLDIEGTSAEKVTIRSLMTGTFWAGIAVPTGGTLVTHYVVQAGGGVHLSGGTATLVDSAFFRVSGDLLTMSGGTVDMEYSAIGREPGEADSTHCDMHFGNSGNVITVTHSNISTSAYGLMFYGGTGANFTYDNWFSNGINVHTQTANPVSGDFSDSWFDKAPPSGTGLVVTNQAGARLTDAGPRP